MKITFKIFLISAFGYFYSSCSDVKIKYYSLKITLDSTFDYGLIDSTILYGENFRSSITWTYDTLNKTTTYYWDSLNAGDYNFKIKSIFSKVQPFKFSLNSDTIFYIKNKLGFKSVSNIDSIQLIKSDTIEFVYKRIDCFGYYFEKSIAVKDKHHNYYLLNINSKDGYEGDSKPMVINRKVYKGFIDSLSLIQRDLKRDERTDGSNWLTFNISTTNWYFYLLAGDLLFKSDQREIDWELHEDFRKHFIIQSYNKNAIGHLY